VAELFYRLKDDWFKYAGERIDTERYLSKCGKFYIVMDKSFWLRVYSGDNSGIAVKIYDYSMNYPWCVGDLKQVDENIKSGKLKPLNVVVVDKSHFKYKKDFAEYSEMIKNLSEVKNEIEN